MLCSDADGLVIRAVKFASIKHSRQRRKDAEETPYINHPISVMERLWSEGGVRHAPTLAAAALHDTLEDTETSVEELEREFGPAVTRIVQEVTDDKALPKHRRKELQIEHAGSISREAKLVKLADKLDNLAGLQHAIPVSWSVARAQAYFGWASEVVGQLQGTNAALEAQLQATLQGQIVLEDGTAHPCIPPGYQSGDWRRATPEE